MGEKIKTSDHLSLDVVTGLDPEAVDVKSRLAAGGKVCNVTSRVMPGRNQQRVYRKGAQKKSGEGAD